MTATTTRQPLPVPPPLRDFLASREDPRGIIGEHGLERLVSDTFLEMHCATPADWALRTEARRKENRRVLAGLPRFARLDGTTVEMEYDEVWSEVVEETWEVEIADDPSLFDGLLGWLPRDRVDELRRRAVIAASDVPLVGERPDVEWRCDGCGELRDAGMLSVVPKLHKESARDGFDARWCETCVRSALEEVQS